MQKETLTASLEDYLETIFLLEKEFGVIRSVDIANKLDVKKPSVNSALKHLAKFGLIKHLPYSPVQLTEKGRTQAQSVLRRHTSLKNFLTKVLMVEEERAEEVACGMEHAIGEDITKRLIKFVEFVENSPILDIQWFQDNGFYCGNESEECGGCKNSILNKDKDVEEK
jgi:DtxR family Mn-dependent transcriptional regulator